MHFFDNRPLEHMNTQPILQSRTRSAMHCVRNTGDVQLNSNSLSPVLPVSIAIPTNQAICITDRTGKISSQVSAVSMAAGRDVIILSLGHLSSGKATACIVLE